MFKSRIKIWAIFLLICIASQFVISAIPDISTSIGRWEAESAYKEALKEREEQTATEPIITEPGIEETTPGATDGELNPDEANKQFATETFSQILSILATTMRFLGTMITIFGIFNLVMGFMHEDSESTTRAISMVVVGAMITLFGSFAPDLLEMLGSQ